MTKESTSHLSTLLETLTPEELSSGILKKQTAPEGLLQESSPEDLQKEFKEAFIESSVGNLLEHARKQSGYTLKQVGEKLGVTKGRISQLEHPDANLELATLSRMAEALGYKLVVTLEPENQDANPLSAHLG